MAKTGRKRSPKKGKLRASAGRGRKPRKIASRRPQNRDGNPVAAGAAASTVPRDGFPIVGIGASAGGLEAFTQLLQNFPMDSGVALVVVQHLDPTHESMLATI